jgi:hypothetical protein
MYFRNRIFDLKVLDDWKKQQWWNLVEAIHICCDIATYGATLTDGTLVLNDILPTLSSLKYIHIYARDFLTDVQGLETIVLREASNFKIQLVCDKLPPQLVWTHEFGKTTPKPTVTTYELYQGPKQCPLLAQHATCPNKHSELVAGEPGWMLKFQGSGGLHLAKLLWVPTTAVSYPTVDDLQAYRAEVYKCR